ncbi:hypothetical protein N0V88_005764 [Collariella sp. IMI 366227]|nr:hypothetical protein N0V88_005764 [Collariella sp. IMI 366227]
MQVSLTLALANPFLWYLIDRSKSGFLLSAAVGLVGALAAVFGAGEGMPAPAPGTAAAGSGVYAWEGMGRGCRGWGMGGAGFVGAGGGLVSQEMVETSLTSIRNKYNRAFYPRQSLEHIKREHAAVDCHQDVGLNKLCDLLAGLLDKAAVSPTARNLRTQVTLWDSKRTIKAASYTRRGGTILAAYALAKVGALDRDASNAMFVPRDTDPDSHASFDADLIAHLRTEIQKGGSLECAVCYDIMSEPVTVPFCGHTFCRLCLHPPTVSAEKCPTCRHNLEGETPFHRRVYPINRVFFDAIAYFWPDLADRESTKIPIRLHRGNAARKTTFPGLVTSVKVTKLVDRCLRNELAKKWFEMEEDWFGAAADGGHKVGTLCLTEMMDPRADQWAWRGKATRFVVHEPEPVDDRPDAFFVTGITPIYDIPIAEEEDREMADTAGNADVVFDPSMMVVTRENMRTLPTKVLVQSAADLVRKCMQYGHVGWLRSSRTRSMGHVCLSTTALPWWFAKFAPLTEAQRQYLLRSTSVRERLKIC